MICKDVATEQVLQGVEGEQLTWVSDRAQAWIYMRVVFGSPSNQPFFNSGFVNSQCWILQRPQAVANIPSTREREKASILKYSPRYQTWNPHPSDFYNNWWNGKGVLELPQQTSRVDCYQERRVLCQDNHLDTRKNLLCNSEFCINLSQRN